MLLYCWSLLQTFIGISVICDFGEKFGTAFGKIQLDQINWYLLPCDTQKILLTILIVTQKPVELNIFGSISCNRITYKKVSFSHVFHIFYYRLSQQFPHDRNSFSFAEKRIRFLRYLNDLQIEHMRGPDCPDYKY